jgi:sulfatase maturation enzyme AslB (radical SAM superfamily)
VVQFKYEKSHFIFNLYRYNETQLHQLKYLFWECTRRCNLNCIHCGSDCSASNDKDMPFDDFLNAIMPFAPVNTKERVTDAITGGELPCAMTFPNAGAGCANMDLSGVW